jgi:hypothetical protein
MERPAFAAEAEASEMRTRASGEMGGAAFFFGTTGFFLTRVFGSGGFAVTMFSGAGGALEAGAGSTGAEGRREDEIFEDGFFLPGEDLAM